MDIELSQQQQEPASSTNEEQVLKQDELIAATAASEPEGNPSDNNLSSAVNTSPEPQPQQRQDVAINMDARFGPSCAPILSDTAIVDNIIETSKKVDARNWWYLFTGCIPTFVVACTVWITWAAIHCVSEFEDDCSTSQVLYIVGIVTACLTGILFLWAIYYGARNYSNGARFNILRNSVRCVVKLEGNQWTRYVNYLYGDNRTGFGYLGVVGAFSFCCRTTHYRQLIERGYGYIVFCKEGVILDEMYHIVRNQPHVFLKVTYIVGMGLRVFVVRSDGTYTVNKYAGAEERRQAGLQAIANQTVPFDISLPDTMPQNSALVLAYQVQFGL